MEISHDREDYLRMLSEEYGVDYYTVSCMADVLGENEDYDGLISALEDLSSY